MNKNNPKFIKVNGKNVTLRKEHHVNVRRIHKVRCNNNLSAKYSRPMPPVRTARV